LVVVEAVAVARLEARQSAAQAALAGFMGALVAAVAVALQPETAAQAQRGL
jgi:hypothetical protein